MSAFGGSLAAGSTAAPKMLSALDYYLDEPLEVLIVAAEDDAETRRRLLERLRRTYLPNRVLSVTTAGDGLAEQVALIPLLEQKHPLEGRTTAYVCKKGFCKRPTSEPEVLATQILEVQPLLEDGKPPALPVERARLGGATSAP